MNSTLKETTVGCRIALDRGPDGVQAMTVTQSNQSAWVDCCPTIYSNVKGAESTSSKLLGFFSSVKQPISGLFHLGTSKINEQLLSTRDPWLEVYRTWKDF